MSLCVYTRGVLSVAHHIPQAYGLLPPLQKPNQFFSEHSYFCVRGVGPTSVGIMVIQSMYHAELRLELNLQALESTPQIRDLGLAALELFCVDSNLSIQFFRLYFLTGEEDIWKWKQHFPNMWGSLISSTKLVLPLFHRAVEGPPVASFLPPPPPRFCREKAFHSQPTPATCLCPHPGA